MEATRADVLGVPVLPPAAAVPIAERARAAIARLHQAMAPPPVRVLEGVFGAIDAAALGALCALDIPDALRGPARVPDLARQVGADPEVVARIVRYAAAKGWLRLDRRGRARPNRVTAFLRRDHPGGWRSWVEFGTGGEVFAALAALASGRGGPDPFASANGMPFFEWFVEHPDRHAVFDSAMAAGGRLHGLVLAAAIDWSAYASVCDVGGGTGAVLGVVLDASPHLQGVLLDLPAVVARATPHERMRVVGGDAFAGLPGGCHAYLFVNVLHDWDDERATDLLRAVARDGGDGAVAIVVEREPARRPVDGIAARTDLLMLALTPGGRERTAREFADLARAAGLRLRRTVRLASGDVACVIGR